MTTTRTIPPAAVFRYLSVTREDPVRMTEWLALRTRLYMAAGILKADELDADGLYRDVYDEHSEHILITLVSGQAVGTCRIIDGRTISLQVKEQFGAEHSNSAFEVSGFAILPEYRKTLASVGVYKFVYDRAIEYGTDEIHFEVEHGFKDALIELGFPLTQTAPEQFTYHSVNVPLKFAPVDLIPELRAADRRRGMTHFAEYFEQPAGAWLDTDSLFRTSEPKCEALAC